MHRILQIPFDSEGTLTGRVYLYGGALLFLIKYCLDFLLLHFLFQATWMPWDYLLLPWMEIDFLDFSTVRFATLMLALSLPFVWAGVMMTAKRLRMVGWPPVWAALFFVPYLNLGFFFLLASWPNAKSTAPPVAGQSEAGGNSVLMVGALTGVAVGLVLISAGLLEYYGWGLFVGTPFLVGFVPGLLHKTSTGMPLLECIAIGWLTELLIGSALLLFALEGVICLLMFAPLGISASAFGTLVGYWIRKSAWVREPQREVLCVGAGLLLPLLLFAEKAANGRPGLIQVTTAVEIAAAPEHVWPHVIAFPELPPPDEWVFRAGVAYPIQAEIEGSGPGAVRYCVFSTGSFVEPILVWDEPHLLRFSVTSNPQPMQELSFREVDPPHLDGFMVSEQGQFVLREAGPGRTVLEGTTWYRHGLWPARYWQLWSDYIIHKIHLRVLNHIKQEAEASLTPDVPTGSERLQ